MIMKNKDFQKFLETGKIDDYLKYKQDKKKSIEVSKELYNGEKYDSKRGNSDKKP